MPGRYWIVFTPAGAHACSALAGEKLCTAPSYKHRRALLAPVMHRPRAYPGVGPGLAEVRAFPSYLLIHSSETFMSHGERRERVFDFLSQSLLWLVSIKSHYRFFIPSFGGEKPSTCIVLFFSRCWQRFYFGQLILAFGKYLPRDIPRHVSFYKGKIVFPLTLAEKQKYVCGSAICGFILVHFCLDLNILEFLCYNPGTTCFFIINLL